MVASSVLAIKSTHFQNLTATEYTPTHTPTPTQISDAPEPTQLETLLDEMDDESFREIVAPIGAAFEDEPPSPSIVPTTSPELEAEEILEEQLDGMDSRFGQEDYASGAYAYVNETEEAVVEREEQDQERSAEVEERSEEEDGEKLEMVDDAHSPNEEADELDESIQDLPEFVSTEQEEWEESPEEDESFVQETDDSSELLPVAALTIEIDSLIDDMDERAFEEIVAPVGLAFDDEGETEERETSSSKAAEDTSVTSADVTSEEEESTPSSEIPVKIIPSTEPSTSLPIPSEEFVDSIEEDSPLDGTTASPPSLSQEEIERHQIEHEAELDAFLDGMDDFGTEVVGVYENVTATATAEEIPITRVEDLDEEDIVVEELPSHIENDFPSQIEDDADIHLTPTPPPTPSYDLEPEVELDDSATDDPHPTSTLEEILGTVHAGATPTEPPVDAPASETIPVPTTQPAGLYDEEESFNEAGEEFEAEPGPTIEEVVPTETAAQEDGAGDDGPEPTKSPVSFERDIEAVEEPEVESEGEAPAPEDSPQDDSFESPSPQDFEYDLEGAVPVPDECMPTEGAVSDVEAGGDEQEEGTSAEAAIERQRDDVDRIPDFEGAAVLIESAFGDSDSLESGEDSVIDEMDVPEHIFEPLDHFRATEYVDAQEAVDANAVQAEEGSLLDEVAPSEDDFVVLPTFEDENENDVAASTVTDEAPEPVTSEPDPESEPDASSAIPLEFAPEHFKEEESDISDAPPTGTEDAPRAEAQGGVAFSDFQPMTGDNEDSEAAEATTTPDLHEVGIEEELIEELEVEPSVLKSFFGSYFDTKIPVDEKATEIDLKDEAHGSVEEVDEDSSSIDHSIAEPIPLEEALFGEAASEELTPEEGKDAQLYGKGFSEDLAEAMSRQEEDWEEESWERDEREALEFANERARDEL
ncbi:hypothetical protein P7C70_g8794, partial [Phenoliferia sp. Uapishka_3]